MLSAIFSNFPMIFKSSFKPRRKKNSPHDSDHR
jgi:hypothetical protein